MSDKIKGYKGSTKCYKCERTSEEGMGLFTFHCADNDNRIMFYPCCSKHAEEMAKIVSVNLPYLHNKGAIYEHGWTLYREDWERLPKGGKEYERSQYDEYWEMIVEDMSNVGPGH